MTGRLPNQQEISKLYYKMQQNGKLKTVSGLPVRAPTQMRVHKGIENTLLFTLKNIIYLSNLAVS
jgi:hypothetical protein